MTSERELKNILIEQCKIYGIRSTGRATIAGCGIDIATFCSVLYYLGIVEPATIQPSQTNSADKTASSSNAEDEDSLTPDTLRATLTKLLTDVKEKFASMNASTKDVKYSDKVVDSSASTSTTTQGDGEGSNVDATYGDASAGDAMNFDVKDDTGGGSSGNEEQSSSITTSNDIQDHNDHSKRDNVAPSPQEDAFRQELISHGIGSKTFFETIFTKESEIFKNEDADMLLKPFFKTYRNALMRYLQDCLNRKMTQMVTGSSGVKEKKSKVDKTAKTGMENTASNTSKTDSDAMDMAIEGAKSHPDGSIILQTSDGASEAAKLNLSDAILPIIPVTTDVPTATNATTTATVSTAMEGTLPSSATSTSNSPASAPISSPSAQNTRPQKGWRINKMNSNVRQLADPQSLLKEWTEASYEEASLLELEERILRRLAGQCNISLSEKPYRSGTRYLSRRSSNKRKYMDGSDSSTDLEVHTGSNAEDNGNALKDGAVFNAQSLWYKAYKARTRKRSRSMGSAIGMNSRRTYSSTAGSMPAVHPNADSALSASTGGGSSFNYDYQAVQAWSQKKNEPSAYVSQQKQKQRNRAHSSNIIMSDSHTHGDLTGASLYSGSILGSVAEAPAPLPPTKKYNNFNNVNVRYLVPLAWNLSDHIVSKNDSMQLKGSLYAPFIENTGRSSRTAADSTTQLNNENSFTEATVLLPDLVINTTEIPWSLVAEEFQVMNAEELDMKDGASSTYTSPRASSRGGSARNSFSAMSRESSLSACVEESPRSDITFNSAPTSPRGGYLPRGGRLSSGGNKSTNSSEAFSSPRINTSFNSLHSSGGNNSYNSDRSDSIFNRNHIIRSMSMNLGVGSLKDVEVPAPVVMEVDYDLKQEVIKLREQEEQEDMSPSDEDFTDEKCLQRHDEVLRNMRQRYEKIKKLKQERKELLLSEQALNPYFHRKNTSPRARGGFVSRSPKFKSKSNKGGVVGRNKGANGAAVKFGPVFGATSAASNSTTDNNSLNAVATALGKESPRTNDSYPSLPEALPIHGDSVHDHDGRFIEGNRAKKIQHDVNMDVNNIIQGEGMAGGYSKRERKVSSLFKDTIPSTVPISPTRKRGRPKKLED
jgi:hypothetical protein